MIKDFNETDIKYLAGLIDADGSLMFHFTKYNETSYNVCLKLIIQQSLSIDHNGKFINWLKEHCGFIQHVLLEDKNPNWSDANRWTVNNTQDLNMLIPRLAKHMVIKAKHFISLLEKYNSIKGKSVTEDQMKELKEFSLSSRKNVGPLKPKKHPTWAWVAGYIDGDGCYYQRSRKRNWGIAKELLVRVVAHNDDKIALEMLQHSFKGNLKQNHHENTWYWSRNLGNADISFALPFLRKMHRHSKLKQHKIELMLNHHLQRLSESASTEDAIV